MPAGRRCWAGSGPSWAAPLGLPVFPAHAQEPVEGCPGLCSVAAPPAVAASLVALEDVKTSPLPLALVLLSDQRRCPVVTGERYWVAG